MLLSAVGAAGLCCGSVPAVLLDNSRTLFSSLPSGLPELKVKRHGAMGAELGRSPGAVLGCVCWEQRRLVGLQQVGAQVGFAYVCCFCQLFL